MSDTYSGKRVTWRAVLTTACNVWITATLFFYGAAKTTIQRLQTVMNAVARLVGGLCKYDHVTPVLRDTLHWLPIQQLIQFKVAVLAFDCVRGTCPSYFCVICTPLTEVGGRVRLRSAHRGTTDACHLGGQNLANAVSELLHPEHGTYQLMSLYSIVVGSVVVVVVVS